MKKILIVLLTFIIGSISFGFGVTAKGGYTMVKGDFDQYSGLALGADVRIFELGPISIAPELIYFNSEHSDYSQAKMKDIAFNVNAIFIVPGLPVKPFAGAGAGFHYITSEIGTYEDSTTKFGLNIFGGIGFSVAIAMPFIEVRYVIIDQLPHIMILGGITLGF